MRIDCSVIVLDLCDYTENNIFKLASHIVDFILVLNVINVI